MDFEKLPGCMSSKQQQRHKSAPIRTAKTVTAAKRNTRPVQQQLVPSSSDESDVGSASEADSISDSASDSTSNSYAEGYKRAARAMKKVSPARLANIMRRQSESEESGSDSDTGALHAVAKRNRAQEHEDSAQSEDSDSSSSSLPRAGCGNGRFQNKQKRLKSSSSESDDRNGEGECVATSVEDTIVLPENCSSTVCTETKQVNVSAGLGVADTLLLYKKAYVVRKLAERHDTYASHGETMLHILRLANEMCDTYLQHLQAITKVQVSL